MGYRDAGPTPHSPGWGSSPPWSSLASAPWTLWHSCQVLDAEGPWQCLSRLSPWCCTQDAHGPWGECTGRGQRAREFGLLWLACRDFSRGYCLEANGIAAWCPRSENAEELPLKSGDVKRLLEACRLSWRLRDTVETQPTHLTNARGWPTAGGKDVLSLTRLFRAPPRVGAL